MGKIILIGLFMASCNYLNFGCSNSSNLKPNEVKIDYDSVLTLKYLTLKSAAVYKIDSINDYYLIYIIKDKERYKIISRKSLQSGCDSIRLGKIYDLQVTKIFGVIAGGVFKPDCLGVDDKTKICLEDSIIDLCYAKNLKGLCIENRK
jgi:hypothetical protein